MRGLSLALVACLALLAPAAPVQAAEPIRIVRVRHASADEYTRIVIDLSRHASFKWGELPADSERALPGRVYVDLNGVVLEDGRVLGLRPADGRVRLLRAGQHKADAARIVVELESEAKAKVFSLPQPARIVIDLSGPRKAVVAKEEPEQAPEVLPSVRTDEKLRIIIDPGHGGRDPGARGRGGLSEKSVVLEVAQRLAAKIRLGVPAEVDLTRYGDSFAALGERKDLANDRKADFFISIHANASDTRRVRGIETYYLKNTDDRATLRLASLENGVDMILRDGDASADADLPYIISDLAQGHKEQESLRLARHVQSELVRHLRTRYSGVDSLGDKQGPFLVLDGTHMPSILVEIGFLTHEVEGARLGSPAYREAVAEGLYRGLRSYLAEDLGRAQP